MPVGRDPAFMARQSLPVALPSQLGASQIVSLPGMAFPSSNPTAAGLSEEQFAKAKALAASAAAKAAAKAQQQAEEAAKRAQDRAQASAAKAALRAQAAEQRACAKAATKAEAERLKGLPENRAKAWALGLQRDIFKAGAMHASASSFASVPEATRTEFATKFLNVQTALERTAQDMLAATEGNASVLLEQGPKQVEEFRQLEREWARAQGNT